MASVYNRYIGNNRKKPKNGAPNARQNRDADYSGGPEKILHEFLNQMNPPPKKTPGIHITTISATPQTATINKNRFPFSVAV